MNKNFDYDVFLSHSSKDKPVVRELAERLRADGLRVWLDEWVIRAGDHISIKIEHGIEKSRTLVVCMSPDFFESDWAKIEHHSYLFRDPSNKHRRLIQLLIADCEIPMMIKPFKHIDWRDKSDEKYQELLSTCSDNEEIETLSVPRDNTQQNQEQIQEKMVDPVNFWNKYGFWIASAFIVFGILVFFTIIFFPTIIIKPPQPPATSTPQPSPTAIPSPSPSPTLTPPPPSPTPVPSVRVTPSPDNRKTQVSVHLSKARKLYSEGKYETAIAECDIALNFDRKNKEAISLKNQIKKTVSILGK